MINDNIYSLKLRKKKDRGRKMLFRKKKKTQTINENLEFNWTPRLIDNGKETIEDMSLIQGMYKGYIVTKTGYLVSIIETSGINLELLNDKEQGYAFDTFNSFLMTTLGDGSQETQQYLDMTMPVEFEDYIKSYKKRYLEESHPERKKLIASYIYDFTEKMSNNAMTNKRHFLVIKEKINDKSLESLDIKVRDLNEKTNSYINRLEDVFEQYDLQAKKLYTDEIIDILKNQFNYNGK